HRRLAAAAGGGRGEHGASDQTRAERVRSGAPPHGGAPPHEETKPAGAKAPAASDNAVPRPGAAEAAEAAGGGVPKDAAPSGERAPQDNAGVEDGELGVDARRQAALRSARRAPFAAYTDLEYEAARAALAPLARRFRLQLG